ncbi:hypothetical protein [Leeia sp.]|uniref:hypothetical protein n=1 Tax=Leeia sp. TaxID=2884678 RepID=UPI0035B361F9
MQAKREPVARYGESYQGPKTLTVELAWLASGEAVLIKTYGVNHPWDGRVLRASLHEGNDRLNEFYTEVEGKECLLMREGPSHGARLYLPGLGELSLSFDREASLQLKPEHLMTDYLQQANR